MIKRFRFFILLIVVFVALALSNPAQADKFSDTVHIFKKSDAVRPFLRSSYGYAVFPTVGKAGISIGGAYGKGQVYHSGKFTREVKLFKATFGFQLGGQAFSEIIFSKTNVSMMNLPVEVLSLTRRHPL